MCRGSLASVRRSRSHHRGSTGRHLKRAKPAQARSSHRWLGLIQLNARKRVLAPMSRVGSRIYCTTPGPGARPNQPPSSIDKPFFIEHSFNGSQEQLTDQRQGCLFVFFIPSCQSHCSRLVSECVFSSSTVFRTKKKSKGGTHFKKDEQPWRSSLSGPTSTTRRNYVSAATLLPSALSSCLANPYPPQSCL